jgi:hypothetical protein
VNIELQLRIDTPTVSVQKGLVVHVTLINRGEQAIEAPAENDRSTALTITSRQTNGEVIRVAHGVTRHVLMSSSLTNQITRWESLPAGASREWTLDLVSYQYPLPVGIFTLEAYCALGDESTVVSNVVTVEAVGHAVDAVRFSRSNSVLDGLDVIIEPKTAEEPHFLRLFNTSRPFGAWYSEPLTGPGRMSVATPSYFSTATFDHFFKRCVLRQYDGKVFIQATEFGRPVGETIEIVLPEASRIIGSGIHEHDRLWLALEHHDGRRILSFVDGQTLAPRYEVPPLHGGASHFTLAEKDTTVVAAFADQGLFRLTLDDAGAGIPEKVFNTELELHSLRVDPVRRCIQAAFWDGPGGSHLQFVACPAWLEPEELISENGEDAPAQQELDDNEEVPVPLSRTETTVRYFERTGLLSQMTDFAWDWDEKGRPHLAFIESDCLYYHSGKGAAQLIFSEPGITHPVVVAKPLLSLGFATPKRGFQIYQYKRGLLLREGPMPW